MVNPEALAFEAVPNASAALAQGAGIQAARLVVGKSVSVALTRHCGPDACQTLSAVGVNLITGCAGPIRAAVEQFKAGTLVSATGPGLDGNG